MKSVKQPDRKPASRASSSSLGQPQPVQVDFADPLQQEGGFLTALAEQIAQRCAALVVARLPKPTVIQPRYMTVEQAAQYIGHSKKSFEYLLSKRILPVIRRDRLVLIDKEDVDKWMANHKC